MYLAQCDVDFRVAHARPKTVALPKEMLKFGAAVNAIGA
jgi:hypothetical protein